MKLRELQLTSIEPLTEVKGKWSPEQIKDASEVAVKSTEYKELIKLIHDVSTQRQWNNGTFEFSKDPDFDRAKARTSSTYTISAIGRLVHGGGVKNNIASPMLTQDNLAENYRRQFQRIIDILKDKASNPLNKSAVKPRTYEDDAGEVVGFKEGDPLVLHNSNVVSLKGSPKIISDMNIRFCHHLVNFEGGPEKFSSEAAVARIENCKQLQNFKGFPSHVGGIFIESCPKLDSLEGLISAYHVNIAKCTSLKSLKGIGQKYLHSMKTMTLDPNVFKSHILGLATIPNLGSVSSVHGLLNKKNPPWYYLLVTALAKFEGKDRVFELQHMLLEHNLDAYAQL